LRAARAGYPSTRAARSLRRRRRRAAEQCDERAPFSLLGSAEQAIVDLNVA
jgi:hypothetical protein